jgi:ketosteroid isomerase-like protein
MSEESTTRDLALLWQRVVNAGNARDIDRIMRFYASDSVYDVSSVG